jgi:hypothetical protein
VKGLRSLSGLHPALRPYAEAAVKWAEQEGVRVEVTSVTRTWTEQERLYANYQTCKRAGAFPSSRSLTPGYSCQYPANPPGYSSHNYGFSWDSVVPEPYMQWWIQVRELYGWRVPSNDVIHAELPDWEQYADPKYLL